MFSLGIFLIALIFFLHWAMRSEYSLLYSNLLPKEAGQVTRKLKEMSVPYKIRDGGGSILVPSSRVHETRLNLAMEGIPEGEEIGFEIFDNTNFIGMTNFMERINYQRALQGELAQTIQSLDEVVQARVHLVLPDESPFIGENYHPRASILLRLKPGFGLQKDQVLGIAKVTAGSVRDLKVEDVTIVDQRGSILFGGGDSSSVHLTTSQIDLKRKIEEYLAGKVRTLLIPVVGSEKAVVKVDARLNFDRITRTAESYDPESKVITSEVRTERRSEGGGTDIVGGVPGTNTNLGKEGLTEATNSGEETVEESSVKYAINKQIERIVKGVGNIERISVAVAVDGTYTGGPGGEKEYIPRDEAQMQKLTSIIKQAVGYDQSRGDKITVTNVPFDTPFRKEKVSFWEGIPPWDLVKYMSRYIIIAVVIIALLLSLRQVIGVLTPETGGGLQEEEGTAETIPFEDEKWLKDHVTQLSEQDPQQVAKIIKMWITNHGRA